MRQWQAGQGMRWWVFGSAALMVVGAFSPWASALGGSISGTDSSAGDGWIVLAAAAVGALLFYLARGGRSGSIWALLAGAGGSAVTIYDRQNMEHTISQGGALVQALVHVGWGLNLAMVASLSLAAAGLVGALQQRAATQPLPPPSSPPPEPTGFSAPSSPPPSE